MDKSRICPAQPYAIINSMITLKNTSVGPLWIEYLAAVAKNGRWEFDSRDDVFETEPICFTIVDFEDSDSIIERHGDASVLKVYRDKMFAMEPIPELNSCYGNRIFDNLGVDQFQWAVNRLRENASAKSCFVPLVVPDDPGPRIPCLSAFQVSIRDGLLQMHCTFRSQNVLNAYGNFIGIKDLMDKFSQVLSVPCGRVYVFVNFPHYYRKDEARVSEILGEEAP